MRIKLELISFHPYKKQKIIVLFCFETLLVTQYTRSSWINLNEGTYCINCITDNFIIESKNSKIRTNKLYFEINSNNFFRLDEKQSKHIIDSFCKKHEAYSKFFWETYWANLHWLSANYPENPTEEDKQEMTILIKTLYSDNSILCPNYHFQYCKFIDNHNVIDNAITHYFINRLSCIKFFVDLHNFINQYNNKRTYTIEDAIQMYNPRNTPEPCKKIIELFRDRNIVEYPKKCYIDNIILFGNN